jgi:hypothetical protein
VGKQAAKRAWRETNQLGMARNRSKSAICGACGQRKKLTKAHVPPQCAGNDKLVGRSLLINRQGHLTSGRKLFGGVFFYGLCEECNNFAGKYDEAYGFLVRHCRGTGVKIGRSNFLAQLPCPRW